MRKFQTPLGLFAGILHTYVFSDIDLLKKVYDYDLTVVCYLVPFICESRRTRMLQILYSDTFRSILCNGKLHMLHSLSLYIPYFVTLCIFCNVTLCSL